MKRSTGRIILITSLLFITQMVMGCGAYKVHPGAAGYTSGTPTATQLYASSTYDSLVATDGVIQQTRADFLANKFPVNAMPTIHTAFNALVSAYDIAQSYWVSLNQDATAGLNPSQSQLAGALTAVQTALNNLTTAKGALAGAPK